MDKTRLITLSGKELELIEKLIAKHGNVVNISMFYDILSSRKSKQEIKNIIFGLTKKGWLVRVKRGIYVISDISGRGTIGFSQLTIAQVIDENSYISFEGALQHYGLFDQYLRTIMSIGRKRTYSAKVSNWTFKYVKSKASLFSDYKLFNLDGRLVKVATKEKAILDFLIYQRNINSIDLVVEKLKNHQADFDLRQFIEISKRCSITTIRALGVVLDLAEINSEELWRLVKDNKNHSFMTTTARSFNAKWRIYIDKQFTYVASK